MQALKGGAIEHQCDHHPAADHVFGVSQPGEEGKRPIGGEMLELVGNVCFRERLAGSHGDATYGDQGCEKSRFPDDCLHDDDIRLFPMGRSLPANRAGAGIN